MKSKLSKVLICLVVGIYVVGFLVLSWPQINALKQNVKNSRVMEQFLDEIKEDGQKEKNQKIYLKKQMEKYNQEIYQNGQKNLRDPFSYQQSSFELKEYGIDHEVAAVINIPKMDVKLPVYLGAAEEKMERGAVHLTQTSLPIGGKNTNCVIAAHRGYRGITFFREIEKLEGGDVVKIQNLWEELTYQVTEIMIISPEEIEKILIREGEDIVTLLTCHPYPTNQYRYVVICKRVDNKSLQTEMKKEEIENIRKQARQEDEKEFQREKYLTNIGYVLYAFIGIFILYSLRKKKV